MVRIRNNEAVPCVRRGTAFAFVCISGADTAFFIQREGEAEYVKSVELLHDRPVNAKACRGICRGGLLRKGRPRCRDDAPVFVE